MSVSMAGGGWRRDSLQATQTHTHTPCYTHAVTHAVTHTHAVAHSRTHAATHTVALPHTTPSEGRLRASRGGGMCVFVPCLIFKPGVTQSACHKLK